MSHAPLSQSGDEAAELPLYQAGEDAAELIGTAMVLAAARAATVEMMRFMVCSFR